MDTGARRFFTNVCGFLIALSLSGCSGLPTAEEAFERGPLPYDVGVYLEWRSTPPSAPAKGAPGAEAPASEGSPPAQPADEPAPASERDIAIAPAAAREQGQAAPDQPAPNKQEPPPPIRFAATAPELRKALEGSLSREGEGTFSRTRVIEAASRAEALRAASQLDALIALRFHTPPEYADRSPTVAWTSVEVVSWLFGGVPAWFVPSLQFLTEAKLDVEVLDLHQPAVRAWLEAREQAAGDAGPRPDWTDKIEAPTENVSLWDRSYPLDRPLDYVLTILVPPIVLGPGDHERVSKELTADVTADLSGDLTDRLRDRFLEAESRKPVSIAFLAPDPTSTLRGESARLTLAIASRGDIKIKAMDVHRFAGKSPRFRHQLTGSELAPLLEQGAAAQGGYMTVELPVEIPLEPGENAVKVRILRDDGLLVTRTMTYVREE